MIQPYPYQAPIIRDVVAALGRDGKALMVMASGTGKTITSALVVQELIGSRKRVLFLCHNNDILRQSVAAYRSVFGDALRMGMFAGDEKADPKTTDFLFASFQMMNRHRHLFAADAFDIVVVDEGHHAHAETFRPTVEYFKPKYLLGMTATPDREDGQDIREVFGRETSILTLEAAIANKYLVPVVYKAMTVGTASREALRRLKSRVSNGERISLRELNDNVFAEQLDEDIAEEIMRYRKQGIVFCTSIKQAEKFADSLKKARPYHSKLSRKELRGTLGAFRRGSLDYLLTVDMFNEGIDIPDAELVVFLRSTESKTIFLQQLGRGLRKSPNKSEVTVLDFVANAERIRQLSEFARSIREFLGTGLPFPENEFELDTSGIEFDLEEETQDILDILRCVEVGFYSFAEAMEVVRRMGVKSRDEYVLRYKADPRLPSSPHATYISEWKGFPHFLTGVEPIEFYSFAEAMEVVRRMGMRGGKEYRRRYKEDPRLPSSPHEIYASEWKGWSHFLTGVEPISFYSFSEAMEVMRRMRIESERDYHIRRKADPRLPSNPNMTYASEWKGWTHFLTGVESIKLYSFAEAMEVARRLGVKSSKEFKLRYKADPRLPSNPNAFYASEWKGWSHFLTGVESIKLYSFAEAMEVARRMGVKDSNEYKLRYKEDPRLPYDLSSVYSSEWKGFPHFLTGVEPIEFYSFSEAMEVVRRMGRMEIREYRRRYKEDSRLPSQPWVFYRAHWKGWSHFLTGVEPISFYSFAEAMEVVQRMRVKGQKEYSARYKEDPRLPSQPNKTYASEWKGWTHFRMRGGPIALYTFVEAMEVVRRMGVKSQHVYRVRYKEDPRLCSTPGRVYASEWKGWPHFLGKKSKKS